MFAISSDAVTRGIFGMIVFGRKGSLVNDARFGPVRARRRVTGSRRLRRGRCSYNGAASVTRSIDPETVMLNAWAGFAADGGRNQWMNVARCHGRRLVQGGLLALVAFVFLTANADAANWTVNVGGAQLAYSPATLTITAGDTVTFTNQGGFHNVAADDGVVSLCAELQRQWWRSGFHAVEFDGHVGVSRHGRLSLRSSRRCRTGHVRHDHRGAGAANRSAATTGHRQRSERQRRALFSARRSTDSRRRAELASPVTRAALTPIARARRAISPQSHAAPSAA